MTKTVFYKSFIIVMSAVFLFALSACGAEDKQEASSAPETLTPEQQVEKLLREEFVNNYGDDLEECKFTRIKIYSAEDMEENKDFFVDYDFKDTDIVFDATYDLKAPDGKDVAPLLPANGEEDGQWVRGKYICGYLTLDDEGQYRLESAGTAF